MDQQDPRTADLGFARVDLDRAARTGDPEVVYGAGKTPEQVVAILRALHEQHPERAVLATRLADEALDAVGDALPDADVDLVARAVTLGPLPEPRAARSPSSAPAPPTRPVAAEAALTVAGARRRGRARSTTSASPGCTGCSPSATGSTPPTACRRRRHGGRAAVAWSAG